MLYGSKCCTMNKQHVHRVCVAKMRMFKWMDGKIEKISNEDIGDNLEVAPLEDKMRGNR